MPTLTASSSMTCLPITILEIFPLSNTLLASSSSYNLLDDRLKTQFTRWSQTRVYRVTSDMRKDAMQERLDKVRTSISRVMFEAVTEADNNHSDINIHSSLSTF
ncbi:spermatogenesis-associated protein 19, mitochondrial [Anolis carolinensis]|uniref:spermatogenesis-associated protein 19, mitochondrial n=1 Tax=Anolis carolinensis TaxID=28377 RepID=UPI002F2B746C